MSVLYNFTGDQAQPNSPLVFDSRGNLYGTATQPDPGLVFKLSPQSGGPWKEKVIHFFANGSDGEFPAGNLVLDSSGNVYGTAMWGGLGCNRFYCGVAYELSPQSGGPWKETILHPFESAEDGSQPGAGLLLDASGNLFGTTYHGGGRYGYGTVFEITP